MMKKHKPLISCGATSGFDEAVWFDYPLPPSMRPVKIHYLDRFRGERRRLEFTRHPYWEFIAVLDGCGRLLLVDGGSETLTPDTVVLVPPQCGHVEEASGRMDLLWIGFDLVFARERTPRRPAGLESAELTRELARLWKFSIGHFDRIGLELEARLLAAVGMFLRLEHARRERGGLRLSEAILELNLHLDEPLPVAELARRCNCSRSHFCREFTRLTGVAPGEYQLRLRLRRAMRFLRETDLPAARVAGLCGFRSAGYFGRIFRLKTGLTPGDYRRNGGGTEENAEELTN